MLKVQPQSGVEGGDPIKRDGFSAQAPLLNNQPQSGVEGEAPLALPMEGATLAPLIDSHCHLSFKDYASDALDALLERAQEAGVETFITIGAGEEVLGNDAALEVARRYPQVFATVGIHPHDAKLVDEGVMEHIRLLALDPKVRAIGEIGLDFHYEHSDRLVQEKVLHSFLDLAKSLDKPVVIHDRDAGDRTLEILREHQLGPNRAVVHCFTGTPELARRYLDAGCLLSFTGILTFKKADEVRKVVKLTPIERMMIETDSPYLAPVPHRGKTNEPAFVKFVAEAIAQIKGLSFEDVGRITSLNARRFFDLPGKELQTQIAYAIRDSLYLNITNRCTLACTFCPKFVDYEVKGYYLKLTKEPSVDDIMAAIGSPSRYKEVVFCGFGEPTRRLDALIEVSQKLKAKHPEIKIRINTDGLGNLVHGRNILPELAPTIDSLSISLNAQDPQTYVRYCPSKYKEAAYPAVKEFIRMATGYIKDVTATAVGADGVDESACQKIAVLELGAKFRFRSFNQVG